MQYQSLEEETDMKLLEERIQRDGIVREGNVLKVDNAPLAAHGSACLE